MSRPELSVVICTWNPVAGLARSLESLECQHLEPARFEVLVVDNSPGGDARPIVTSRIGCSAVMLRYVREPELGASAARNRGVLESRGRVVAFLDDDARADAGWCSSILQAYEALPDAACIGGRIVLEGCDAAPAWWQPAFNEACGELNYSSERQRVGYPRYPYAGNLSFRRDVFERVGLFSKQLGPVGHRHLDGEEFELCLRLERHGGAIYFDPAVRVYHAVSPARLTRRFLFHKAFHHGRTMAMIEAGHLGRRFALWRSLQVRRDLVRRRRAAMARFGVPAEAAAGGVPPAAADAQALEEWLLRTAMPQQGGLTMKVMVQGVGYGWQMLGREIWRKRRTFRTARTPPAP